MTGIMDEQRINIVDKIEMKNIFLPANSICTTIPIKQMCIPLVVFETLKIKQMWITSTK
jgi:hypothetical protein